MSRDTEFYLTWMGRKFYEGTLPRIASALETIATEFVKFNDRQDPNHNDDCNGCSRPEEGWAHICGKG